MSQPTKIEIKTIILKLINDARKRAMRADQRACADVSATLAGKIEWERHNPDDGVGGILQCPYNPSAKQQIADVASQHHTDMDEVYSYAIRVFVVEESDE